MGGKLYGNCGLNILKKDTHDVVDENKTKGRAVRRRSTPQSQATLQGLAMSSAFKPGILSEFGFPWKQTLGKGLERIPGGPVVGSPCSTTRHGFDLWSVNQDPTCHSEKKKKRKMTKDLKIICLGDDLKDKQQGNGEIRQEKEDSKKKKKKCYIKPITPVGN